MAKRHPIKNFIILPELQWPYIFRILALVNLSVVLMVMTICVLFYIRFEPSGVSDETMSMVNQNFLGLMIEQGLVDILIPAFIMADLVSLAIGLVLSLYFSRKISVPIYRISKWAELVEGGDLAYRLQFRPGDNLQNLEDACNRVSIKYARIIDELREEVENAKLAPAPKLDQIRATLGQLRT